MVLRQWKRLTRRQQVAAVALIAIAAGALAAPQVYAQANDSDAHVAVIEISGVIDSNEAQDLEDRLREARTNESIDAVVLDVDSPGGQPASSERMYMAVERTAAKMPVVAAVDQMGTSGGYYAMLPADEIYVASSSGVGSVGVIGPAPTPTGPSEERTAPDKGTTHPDDARADTELIKRTFVESVFEQRGDDLELTREEVSHARTYYGTEAVANGIADEIGTVDDAVHDAATAAGVESYDVVTYRSETADSGLSLGLEAETVRSSTTLNPYQPQLVAPEVWYDEVDDADPDGTDTQSAALTVEAGGETE
ncbi:S49 family peptidase [Natronorubrum aibiense]|uniref:S49 family peptidase n=1 Tax=Natronorubrum aibiense TaxID=348826 RepID=A0A5P9P2U5_9EURY|nr:S49 family peptidase [Natronorubrum aibiense]QFU82461.1 S49 family peptidase [Natronorubrum aibiense]